MKKVIKKKKEEGSCEKLNEVKFLMFQTNQCFRASGSTIDKIFI